MTQGRGAKRAGRTWVGLGMAAAGLCAASLWIAGAGLAQQDFSQIQITSQQLSDGLHMLQGSGGNLALLVGSDGALLVDDQYAPLSEKIAAKIREIDPSLPEDSPVRFVVNTHWHGDHTGGNENFGQAGAVIVAHGNVRERMSVEQFMEMRNRRVPASPPGALPVVTFEDEIALHWNQETVRVIHVDPAHTDGDSLVLFEKADVVHMGDLFFNGFYPFVDIDSGGSLEGMIAAQQKVLDMVGPGTQIIPGHGPLTDAAGLRKTQGMLQTVLERVQASVAKGESARDLIARDPLADLNEEYGGGFMNAETFLTIVHADLSRG